MKRLRTFSAAVLLGTAVGVAGCRMSQSPLLGVQGGRLLPCPPSPNCVCSQDPGDDHAIAPLIFSGTSAAALECLRGAVQAQPRSKIVEEGENYLRAEFRSLVFRFVDDVEFLADPAAKVIHVRSASRVGYSDLGVNRRRVEQLRSAFDRAR